MNPRLIVLLLCASLLPAVQAKAKTILPDACGDDNVQFEVKTVDDHSQALKPADGKALLVIVEEGLSNHFDLTTRYGLDGQWVGATHGNSYFLLEVTPGEHHLCGAPQKHFGITGGAREHMVGVVAFTAEAGKVYFFGSRESSSGSPGQSVYVAPAPGSTGTGHYAHSGGSQQLNVAYGFLPEDDGKYRVKAGKLATWKSKK
jgi:hypothetical protein